MVDLSEFTNSPEYKKLPPKGQELFKQIMTRCALTGENPSVLYDQLKAELERRKKMGFV
jgi:hypothetical protein